MATYDVGDMARLSASFTDINGAAVDPTAVKLTYTKPDGVSTTLIYGTDAAVIKDSAGHYHADVNVTAAGDWWYSWWSTGTGQAAEEGVLTVRTPRVVRA